MQVLLLQWRFLWGVPLTLSANPNVGPEMTQCAMPGDATADTHLGHNVQTMFIVHLHVVIRAQYATLESAFAVMCSEQMSAL